MRKKTTQIIIISVLLMIAIGFGVGVGLLAWTIKTAPDISKIAQYKPSEATTILSEDGKTLARLYVENRIYVPLSRIPMDLQNALIASEDQRFWEHPGFNFWAILRAIYVDIKTGSKAQGASTITQQLARNIALTKQKLFTRKIQEIYIAVQLERMYTKEEILEMFLNMIFFGHSAKGAQTAAQQYFGKDVENLTLSESALLIGIMPAPNVYSPYVNMERAVERRNIVLNVMVEEGYISRERAEKAKAEPVRLAGLKQNTGDGEHAPYFVRYVRDKVIKMYGSDAVYKGGLKIYTTLDFNMQKAAEQAVATATDPQRGYIPNITRDGGAVEAQPQISVLSIDPRNGHIKAMIGGRGGENDKFNRATQALRQPGSAFKPLVYAAALETGYTPGSVIDDVLGYYDPSRNVPWPTNYNDKYLGPVTLRTGLKESINTVAVKLLDRIKVDTLLKMAERLQITTLVKEGKSNDRNLSIALGGLTKGVIPMELVGAYSVFANRGIYTEPVAITKIEDSEGHIIYQANPKKKIVLKEEVAYLLTDMLRSVVTDGTGWRAAIEGRHVAGKTGTTSDLKDAWFVGYTPDIVTSVWIGEDTPRPMVYTYRGQRMTVSSSDATRLWADYMKAALKSRPVLQFQPPASITSVVIDPMTGKLPNSYAPKTVNEIFRQGTEPTEIEQAHQPTVKVNIDVKTGQLATSNCPKEQVVQYTYQQASGIRVGPATINATISTREGTDKATYVFEPGVPVLSIDPKTGVPASDASGRYTYQYMPTVKCKTHGESILETVGTETKNVIDSIWDYLGGGNGN